MPRREGIRQAIKGGADAMFMGFNVSLFPKTANVQSAMDESDDNIDPCLASLQQNESDVVFMPYSMPTMLANITTGVVAHEAKIGMMSTYKFESDDSKLTIFETFTSFSAEVCFLIFCTILAMYALIGSTYILEKKQISSELTNNGIKSSTRFIPELILSYFVKQFGSWPGDMNIHKGILFGCLMTFSYFITYYYSSMIKTDMVTVKAPHVVRTYQDVLDDPTLNPGFIHFYDEYRSFKTAPTGSLKNKIWERLVKNGVDKYVIETSKPDALGTLDEEMKSTKGVLFSFSNAIDAGKTTVLSKIKKSKLRMMISFDPSEHPVIGTFVMNSFMPTDVSLGYRKRMRGVLESHIFVKLGHQFGESVAASLGELLNTGQDFSDIESYVSERILLPEPELFTPDVQYMMPLLITFLVLCAFSFGVFVIEILVSEWNKNTVLLHF